MLNRLKEKASSMINPIALVFVKLRVSPNQITLIGFFTSILSAYMFYSNALMLASALLLLAGFFDVLDGALARLSNKVTKWGGVLDSFLDRYSDMVVIAGIIVGDLCDLRWGLAAMMGSLMVSYARSRGELEGVKLSSIGLMERAERILLLAVFSIINYVWLGIVLLAVFSNITAIHRLIHIRSVLKKINGPP